MRIVVMFSLALVILSCSKKDSPEQILTSFVNYRFSQGQTRERLLEMTSGELHQSISAMSDEAFEVFSKLPIKKRRFKIIKTRCLEGKCSISYFIKYETFKGEEKTSTVETKKIAVVKNIEGMWKIANVSNIKEFHDSTQSVDIIGD